MSEGCELVSLGAGDPGLAVVLVLRACSCHLALLQSRVFSVRNNRPPPPPSPCLVSDEARSKKCGILVHCLAGISRSVTVTVAYLMQKLNLSLNDAYDFVKRKKSNISPNFNFMGQLLDFERTLGLNSPCDNRSPSEQLYFTTPTNHNLFQLNTLEST